MSTYTRILSKPQTQALLKQLRADDDLEVTKLNSGYEVVDIMRDDALVFRAMNGNNSYLCRVNEEYLPRA